MRCSRHDEVENGAEGKGSHAEGMQNETKKYTRMKTEEEERTGEVFPGIVLKVISAVAVAATSLAENLHRLSVQSSRPREHSFPS